MIAKALLAAALTASAAPRPEAWDVLKRSLSFDGSYQGRARVETKAGSRDLTVRVAPGGRYRREIGGKVVVSDGATEWIYDASRNKVWQGAPAEPNYKLLGPREEFELLSA